jgi:hypothetical protein
MFPTPKNKIPWTFCGEKSPGNRNFQRDPRPAVFDFQGRVNLRLPAADRCRAATERTSAHLPGHTEKIPYIYIAFR